MRMTLGLVFLIAASAADVAESEYTRSIEQWRSAHEQTLKSDNGWLAVAGLFWLKDGANRAGSDPKADVVLPDGPNAAGVFTLRAGAVTFRTEAGAPERHLEPNTDVLSIGRLKIFVIERGDKVGLRMRDPESKMRREFTGERWYPVQADARVTAKFVAEPRKIRIPNVLGQTSEENAPGYAAFQWRGREVKLYPTADGDRLFFIFRDQTSAHGTYGAGRFLYTELPKDGRVVLDFNKAENPPCAFTPYATCPLPPKENRLDVRIEAGERDYGNR